MAAPIYSFAGFELDEGARTLVRGDGLIALPAKAFDCIIYLIEHRDRAVGRDELIAAVWDKADVTDGVLGQTILLARRALGDTGKTHRFIRTVVRFGYHWLAPTEVRDAPLGHPATPSLVAAEDSSTGQHPDSKESASATEAARTRLARWRPGRAGLAFAAVACIALGSLPWMLAHAPRDAAPANSIAVSTDVALVLPVSVTGDPQSAWIRLGVMDLVAARLRVAGQATVPSDNVVALAQAYEHAATDPRQLQALADAADARFVIDGRADLVEGRWRVSLRTLLGRVPPITASAESADVLGAAREATDRLGIALGLSAHRPADPSGSLSSDPLVQQVEAALLEDRVDTARTLLDRATPAQRREPAVRFQLGRVDFQSGRLDTAEVAFRALATDVAASDDPAMHGQALNALGGIALQRQHPDAALPVLDAAIDVLGRSGAIGALGKTYGNRAAAHAMRGDDTAELADLAQARIALMTSGDLLGLAVIDSNAATSAMNHDHFAEAAPVLADAIKHFASFHAYAAELNAVGNQAQLELAMLDPAAALDTSKRLMELAPLVPDPERRRAADLIHAEALFANGRITQADTLLLQLLANANGDTPTLAGAQALAARSALGAGNPSHAEREAVAALATSLTTTDPRETARTWLTLVQAQLASGDSAAADASLTRAAAWATGNDSVIAHLYVTLARAERAAFADDPAAREGFEDALAQAVHDRVPLDVVTVSEGYAIWLMQRRDFSRASDVAEGVAAWTSRDYTAAVLRVRVFHALHDPTAWQASLAQAKALAGEREIPPDLARSP